MDGSGRKIEIFEPFSQAIDRTKLILFQPFDLAKWMTIGFAAFLAGLADGTRSGFPTSFGSGDFKGDTTTRNLTDAQEQMMSWITASLIGVIGVVVVIMILLFMWLGSRGRFMFIDCIVRNRGAIAEPWREYRAEGNSLFLFTMAAGVVWLLVAGLLALPILVPIFRTGEPGNIGAGTVVYLVSAITVFVLLVVAWALIVWLMVPVMYCRRCRALAGLQEVMKLIAAHPWPILLFALFGVVLAMAGAMLGCLAMCLTCCIAAIPYIGTVLLLPLYTFLYSYTLLFLRQFGPEYDPWANLAPAELPAPVDASSIMPPPNPVPPPVQPPPAEPPPQV